MRSNPEGLYIYSNDNNVEFCLPDTPVIVGSKSNFIKVVRLWYKDGGRDVTVKEYDICEVLEGDYIKIILVINDSHRISMYYSTWILIVFNVLKLYKM